jgi:hypothetical protein
MDKRLFLLAFLQRVTDVTDVTSSFGSSGPDFPRQAAGAQVADVSTRCRVCR